MNPWQKWGIPPFAENEPRSSQIKYAAAIWKIGKYGRKIAENSHKKRSDLDFNRFFENAQLSEVIFE
jgi:hypothetical protein